MTDTANPLVAAAETALARARITPGDPPRSLHWITSFELAEEYLVDADGEPLRTLAGYPVVREPLIGEEMLLLIETVASEHVPLPVPLVPHG